MMKLKKVIIPCIGLVLYCIFFISTLSCNQEQKQEKESQSQQSIKIIDGLSANSMHVLIADKKGFFKEEGLRVQVSYTSIGKFAMDALNSGSVDYAGIVEMNIAHTLFTHKDIAVLCEYSEPTTGIKVLGRVDKGVTGARSLRGKKIGVFYGVNIHVFITRLLEENGINENEVELINLKPPDAASAFISGTIDAVITWQPHVFNIQKKVGEQAVIITEDSQAYWPYKLLLATKRTYLDNHSEEAKKVLRAMIKADEFIAQEPGKAYELLADHLKLDRNNTATFCSEIHYEIRLTKKLIDMIAFEVEWLPKHLPTFFKGKDPKTKDFRSLIADHLKLVKPDAFKIE